MSHPPGTRIGPYEVLGAIGAGGMGEVYRARDTKLGREVAVKVLPAAVAGDPEALARFEREARAVAQLSHPNILAIHDFGKEGEVAYAVMELLEGETLRTRLQRGALQTRKAVDLAVQIAEGLAAAHEKGIVHRDLKPENIFVTHEGRAKLLDFGLAKRTSPDGSSRSDLKTFEQPTEPGTVMGTAEYMSPEQVRGEVVDHRSDIFSFGTVLYEMLFGRRAFERGTTPESMTAILNDDPPEIAAGGSGVSPALAHIVHHCLEKKPAERFQSARDIAFDLRSFSGSAVTSRSVAAIARGRSRLWLAVVAAAAVLGLLAVGSYRLGNRSGLRSVAKISFHRKNIRRQAIFQAAFAPDGETIVYSAAPEGNVPELFVIRPEYPAPQPLGFPRTHLLAISSKGELAVLTKARYIVHRLFVGTLARVPLGGGAAPREIVDGVRQAAWSPDGSEIAIIRTAAGKDRLEYPIGKVLYETAGYLSDLRISPRGDRIALFEHLARFDDRGSVITVDRAGKRGLLAGDFEGVEGLAWSPAGDEVLFTASAGAEAMSVHGVDLSGHRRVVLNAGGLTIQDISLTGRWLVTRDDKSLEISVLAPGSNTERNLSWLDGSYHPVFSRDGSKFLFTEASDRSGPNYAVCLRESAGGLVVRLGEGAACDLSPDGNWALAVIVSPPQIVIYPTGPGETRRLPRGNLTAYQWPAHWFPDGKSVLLVGSEAGKASRCYRQDISGGLPQPVTPEATDRGMVSPDGRQIIYSKAGGSYFRQSIEGGTADPVPGLTPEDQVIQWAADGRAVYVCNMWKMPFRIERLDVTSGRRELIREVCPADTTGILRMAGATLTDDTKAYAYGYLYTTSQLFVVEGAR